MKSQDRLTFHHGPLFKGRLSSLGLLLGLIGLGMTIYGLVQGDLTFILSGLLSGIGGFEIGRNIRGVIVDRRTNTVTSYLQLFGFRQGPSKPLDLFDQVVLLRFHDNLRFRAYTHFEIELQDVDGKLKLFLEETDDPRTAQQRLKEIADQLELPAVDNYEERVQHFRKRRAKVDPRSVRRRRKR